MRAEVKRNPKPVSTYSENVFPPLFNDILNDQLCAAAPQLQVKQETKQHEQISEYIERDIKAPKQECLVQRQVVIQQNVRDGFVYIEGRIDIYKSDFATGKINEHNFIRWEVRERAFQQSKQDNFKSEVFDYPFSQEVADLLEESCREFNFFEDFDNSVLQESISEKKIILDGSAIQHCLQREMTTILDDAAAVRHAHMHSPSVRLLTDTIGGLAHVGTECNQIGDLKKMIIILDCCASVVESIALGVVDGGIGCLKETADAIVYAFIDPCGAAITVAESMVAPVVLLGKVIVEVCEVAGDCMIDTQLGLNRINRSIDNASAVITALREQAEAMPLREKVAFVTKEGLKTALIHKGSKVMATFCQGAQVQAAKIAEKINQGLAPQMVFAGAEGCHELALTSQAAESMYMLYEGEALAQTGRAVVALEKEIVKDVAKAAKAVKYIPFHKESKLLAKKFNNIREYMGKKLYFSFEHIFEGEIYKKGGLGGFHHDYLGHAKRTGSKRVKDIKDFGNGFYKAHVLDKRGKWVEKSFFPDSWTRKKVMRKTIEAFDNIVEDLEKISFGDLSTRVAFKGVITEGIEIKIVIDKMGKVITVYPDL